MFDELELGRAHVGTAVGGASDWWEIRSAGRARALAGRPEITGTAPDALAFEWCPD